ncbi:MAG: GNAT family N-acetyltransferase [Chloroflexota bacterium]|jgi:predicted acetyltransferase
MRVIREVTEDELDEFLRITTEAFPGMKVISRDDYDQMLDRLRKVMKEPIVHFFGVWEKEKMVGVMRLYDFTMKIHSTRTLVGGIGGVAVDLRHKKEHVAADMLRFFLDYYKKKGACLTALYPFRPDFYRRMGFGYGSKTNRYSFPAHVLPANVLKNEIDFLNVDDRHAVHDCYDRFLERTNGLIELPPHVLESLFTDPALKLVGYKGNGHLRGYLVFRFDPIRDDNFLLNNLHVRALIYDDSDALLSLLAFLRKQADQVNRIIFETQDDMFYHLLNDPRNGTGNLLAGLWHETNTQGMGIMYRVIDVSRLFEVLRERDFGGVDIRLRLDLVDTFYPENAGSYLLRSEKGKVELVDGDGEACAIEMDVSTFSSLIVGAIDFRRVYEYGMATISDPAYVPLIDRLFHTDQRPMCLTSF